MQSCKAESSSTLKGPDAAQQLSLASAWLGLRSLRKHQAHLATAQHLQRSAVPSGGPSWFLDGEYPCIPKKHIHLVWLVGLGQVCVCVCERPCRGSQMNFLLRSRKMPFWLQKHHRRQSAFPGFRAHDMQMRHEVYFLVQKKPQFASCCLGIAELQSNDSMPLATCKLLVLFLTRHANISEHV